MANFREAPRLPVAVVVIGWNSGAALVTCLAAALRESPAEVLLIDNGSTDASIDQVRAKLPRVRIISLAENLGFAAASNLGVHCSQAPLVFFLNDDAVLEPGHLTHLVAALLRRPDAASVQGKLVSRQGGAQRIDSAGILLGARALRPLDRGHGELDHGQYDRPGEIFGPTGAAALYRREALMSIPEGPFDASLFAYYEDVDLAWQLNRRGWRHLYAPAAVAVHPRRGPEGKPVAISARAYLNRYRVWRKNEDWWRFALYGPGALLWESARLLRLGLRRPAFLAHILCQAVGLPPAAAPSAHLI